MDTAFVNAIGTSVPAHDIHAGFIRFANLLLKDGAERRLFNRMVGLSGIEHRYSHLEPADGADEPMADRKGFYTLDAFPGTGDRLSLYPQLGLDLCLKAIAALDRDLGDTTHLIFVSCTGFSAPGIDQMLVEALNLNGDVERTTIGFMGCAAAVNALRFARHIIRSEPSSQILVVNLELCSLHFQQTDKLQKLLSGLLFADGCAASLITARPEGIRLRDFRTVSLPDSADLITWRIGDQGFEMHLSGEVPQRLGKALENERKRNDGNGIFRGMATTDYRHWAVHPGGRTILDAVERGLELPSEALRFSRDILRRFGNMSSATLMFVLQALMHDESEAGSGMAMAFGPGLTAETFRFDLLERAVRN